MNEDEARKILKEKAVAHGFADQAYEPAAWMVDAVLTAVKVAQAQA